MDVVSSNIANAQTTRATMNEEGEFEPYRRKMVAVAPNENSFKSFLQQASSQTAGSGVRVSGIEEDETPFKSVYNPNHPDANEAGYVQLPNVDLLKDLHSAAEHNQLHLHRDDLDCIHI